jgi:ligand-binding sensor domain-containing protein
MMHLPCKCHFLVLVFIFLQSCKNEAKYVPFPGNESEFAAPVVKKLGKPDIIKVKPLKIPLGKGKPDSIKPPEIVKLGKPKIVPFITNKKPLGNPEIVPFKQPDKIYYFTNASKALLQKKYPGKPLIKAQEPITKTIKPKIVMLGQPEKVICKPAQTADNAINNLKFYSQDQGLIATVTHCMCFDKKGNLWLGTDGGLCKFDGKEWWNYNIKQGLSNNNIVCLLESKDGNLIIGSAGGGLIILDTKNQYLKRFGLSEGLTSDNVKCLLLSRDGNILIGTSGGGLCTLNPATLSGTGDITDSNISQCLKNYSEAQGLSNNEVSSLLETRDGHILIGTNGGGLNVLDYNPDSNRDQSLKHYSEAQGLSNNFISCLLESKDGNLIIGTNDGGLNILDLGALNANSNRNFSQSLKHYSSEQGLSNNSIKSLLESRDGNLIIGTFGGGLNIMDHGALTLKDSKNQILLCYSKKQGLSNNNICSLLENRNGQILIGTFGGGLNVLDDNLNSHHNQFLRNYGAAVGLSDGIVLSLFEGRNGNLIIGNNGGGVNILNEKSQIFKLYSKEQGLRNNNVFSLLENYNGNLIVGTDRGGLNIINIKKNILEHYGTAQGLNSNNVWSLLENKEGNLVIGTSGGGLNILNFKSQYLISYNTKQGLSNNFILSLLESRDRNLIIGTSGGGLNILDSKGQNLTNLNIAHGLSSNDVMCLLESRDGNLFVGTSRGLNILDCCVFKPGNSIRKNLLQYSTAQGLPSDYILSIKEDSLGNIWLGTGKGLCKLGKKNGEYVLKKNFDKREGLKYVDFNNNAMCLTKKGKLWAGIGEALTEFDPYISIDTLRPYTYITAIDLMGSKEAWLTERRILQNLNLKDTIWTSEQDTFYSNGKFPIDTSYFVKHKIKYSSVTEDIYHIPIGLQLPFNQNHLTFHFTGICIAANADRIRYRYILEGLDDTWSSITEKSEADYRNIPPGNYSFKVAARSIDGYWSNPVSFSFKVLPPWYQTFWAIAGYTTLLITFIFGFTRWRQIRLRKFSNLMIKAQEDEKLKISRDLHDDLGQELSFYRMNFVVQEEAKNAIDRIIEKVRTISYNLRPIKALDADIKEDLEALINGVKKDTVFFSYDIESILDLTQEQKINIYRITQEAINNIVKHSKANNARVTLTRQGEFVVLEILDDGIGFLINTKTKSVGLKSMKERANLISANLTIMALEKGTKITLKLKHE